MKLNTNWTLSFEHPESGKAMTIPAQVPGNVIGDLHRANIIPDPYYGCNTDNLRPWEFADWTYRTEFAAPELKDGERLQLTLNAVDTVFTLFINGKVAGSGKNMFIEHRFDVTDFVHAGNNVLEVRIQSSVNAARNLPLSAAAAALPYNYEGLALRRAMHTYGWDIAPRIVGAGLWRDVTLDVLPPERWTEVYLSTDQLQEDGSMHCTLAWHFTTPRKRLDGFSATLKMNCGKKSFEERFTPRFTAGQQSIVIPAPELWEPLGWGKPNLYDCELILEYGGKAVAVHSFRTGLRTVELVRSECPAPGEKGEFQFIVNNRKLFVRGSNWVPTDALHGEHPERVVKDVELFAELGCNMIRCWGGGVYEDHDFFDRCDELGLLVWQDFMLACEHPLQSSTFRAEMAQEAESVIRKLRQHPSLAIWSGDNECDAMMHWRTKLRKLPPSTNLITREVLPHAVWEHDPVRDYLPSSPYLNDEVWRSPEKFNCPEQHLWGPRDDFKGTFYRNHTAVFASEIGYHGMPSPESIREFLPEANRNGRVGDPGWNCHAAQPFGDLDGAYSYRTKLMIDQVLALFGTVPEDLEPFAELSQIVQAEAFKYFIESFRIRKFARTGLIWWNVIDCWPQFSDAVVDYYYRKKLAFAYIRQSQQTVAMMFDEPEAWNIRLYAVNDTLADRELDYEVEEITSGEKVLSGHVRAAANASVLAAPLRMSCGEQKMYLIRWQRDDGVTGVNHYLQGTAPFAPELYRKWLAVLQQNAEYQLMQEK